MGCGRCGERRQDLITAAKAIASGEVVTAAVTLGHVGRTMSEDVAAIGRAAGQRLSAAHARLKR